MSVYSVWPGLLILLIIFNIYRLPFFSHLDEPPQRTINFHVLQFDGLRGVLALSVVLHHLVINWQYQKTGIWAVPESNVFTQLGQVGVAFFFIITAYLFTGKVMNDKVNWLPLYVGRVFRIGPLYLVAAAIVRLIVGAKSGFQINESLSKVLHEAFMWLFLGLPKILPDVNGVQDTRLILAGVVWSIHYEWLFYFGLFFIWIGRKHPELLSASLLIISLIILFLTKKTEIAYCTLFSCGIFARCWRPRFARYLPVESDRILSVVALFTLMILMTMFHGAYKFVPVVMTLIVFLCICNGASMFGFLTSRSAHRVGNMSYGIYLLQGIPMAVVFAFENVKQWALESAEHYWSVAFICVTMTLIMAAVGYSIIEKPGIAAGKFTAARLVGWRSRLK